MAGTAAQPSISFVSPFLTGLFAGNGAAVAGGAERQLYLFARGLAERGWRVALITGKPHDGEQLPPGLSAFPACFSYLGGSKIRLPLDWLSLLEAMRKADTDYYVLKVPGHLLAPMSVFCTTAKRKLVFWAQMTFDANPGERTELPRFASRLQDWGLRRADVVIAQSEEQQRNFWANYRCRAQVVPSICDHLLRSDSPAAVNRQQSVDILWAGNSWPKKRQEILFALAKILSHRTFAMAMYRSDSSRFDMARQAAAQLPNVRFLGTVPPTAMESWYQRARLFLNTSIREGYPNSFLQSWANGVPVVSFTINPDDIIRRQGLGAVAAPPAVAEGFGDNFYGIAELLAPHVESLLANEQARAAVGSRAIRYVAANHSPAVVVPRFCQALGFQ